MEITFIADKITYERDVDYGFYMIGFSDNVDYPEEYVILQRAISFDKQDIACGMDTYYFEYSSQSNSGYGICKEVELKKNKIVFKIIAKKLKEINSITISFQDDTIQNRSEFQNILNKIISHH